MKHFRVHRKLIPILLCLSIVAGFFSGTVPAEAAADGQVTYEDGSFSASSTHDTATPTGWRYTTVGLILHKKRISGGNAGSKLGITAAEVKAATSPVYHADGNNSYVIIGRNGFTQSDAQAGDNNSMTQTTYTVTNAEGIYRWMKNVNAELTDATWYMSAVIEVTLRLATGTDGSGAEDIGSTSRGAHYMMSGGSVTGEYNITAGNVANYCPKTFLDCNSGIISWASSLKGNDPAMNWSGNTLNNVLPTLFNMPFENQQRMIRVKVLYYDVDGGSNPVYTGYLASNGELATDINSAWKTIISSQDDPDSREGNRLQVNISGILNCANLSGYEYVPTEKVYGLYEQKNPYVSGASLREISYRSGIRQYTSSLANNELSCVYTGWNHHDEYGSENCVYLTIPVRKKQQEMNVKINVHFVAMDPSLSLADHQFHLISLTRECREGQEITYTVSGTMEYELNGYTWRPATVARNTAYNNVYNAIVPYRTFRAVSSSSGVSIGKAYENGQDCVLLTDAVYSENGTNRVIKFNVPAQVGVIDIFIPMDASGEGIVPGQIGERHLVRFIANGGTLMSEQNGRYVDDGKQIGSFPEATRNGYYLAGWSTKADGTGTIIGKTYRVRQDMTLYAIWKTEQMSVTVKYIQSMIMGNDGQYTCSDGTVLHKVVYSDCSPGSTYTFTISQGTFMTGYSTVWRPFTREENLSFMQKGFNNTNKYRPFKVGFDEVAGMNASYTMVDRSSNPMVWFDSLSDPDGGASYRATGNTVTITIPLNAKSGEVWIPMMGIRKGEDPSALKVTMRVNNIGYIQNGYYYNLSRENTMSAEPLNAIYPGTTWTLSYQALDNGIQSGATRIANAAEYARTSNTRCFRVIYSSRANYTYDMYGITSSEEVYYGLTNGHDFSDAYVTGIAPAWAKSVDITLPSVYEYVTGNNNIYFYAVHAQYVNEWDETQQLLTTYRSEQGTVNQFIDLTAYKDITVNGKNYTMALHLGDVASDTILRPAKAAATNYSSRAYGDVGDYFNPVKNYENMKLMCFDMADGSVAYFLDLNDVAAGQSVIVMIPYIDSNPVRVEFYDEENVDTNEFLGEMCLEHDHSGQCTFNVPAFIYDELADATYALKAGLELAIYRVNRCKGFMIPSYRKTIRCNTCNGTGVFMDDTCLTCHGEGTITVSKLKYFNGGIRIGYINKEYNDERFTDTYWICSDIPYFFTSYGMKVMLYDERKGESFYSANKYLEPYMKARCNCVTIPIYCECARCQGTGVGYYCNYPGKTRYQITSSQVSSYAAYGVYTDTCDNCTGKGYYVSGAYHYCGKCQGNGYIVCDKCHGTGRISRSELDDDQLYRVLCNGVYDGNDRLQRMSTCPICGERLYSGQWKDAYRDTIKNHLYSKHATCSCDKCGIPERLFYFRDFSRWDYDSGSGTGKGYINCSCLSQNGSEATLEYTDEGKYYNFNVTVKAPDGYGGRGLPIVEQTYCSDCGRTVYKRQISQDNGYYRSAFNSILDFGCSALCGAMTSEAVPSYADAKKSGNRAALAVNSETGEARVTIPEGLNNEVTVYIGYAREPDEPPPDPLEEISTEESRPAPAKDITVETQPELSAMFRNSLFTVDMGIPSGKSVYAEADVSTYKLSLSLKNITGTRTCNVTVSLPYVIHRKKTDGTLLEDVKGNVTTVIPVTMPYSYWTVDRLLYYKLKNVRLQNESLYSEGDPPVDVLMNVPGSYVYPECGVTRYSGEAGHTVFPKTLNVTLTTYETTISEARNVELPSIDKGFAQRKAKAEVLKATGGTVIGTEHNEGYEDIDIVDGGGVNVRNDYFRWNGTVILSGSYDFSYADSPVSYPYSAVPLDKLISRSYQIPKIKANGIYASSGEAVFELDTGCSIGSGTGKLTEAVGTGRVVVHTPVYGNAVVTADNAPYVQAAPGIEETGKAVNVVLGINPERAGDVNVVNDFTLKVSAYGTHRNIKGYGTRDYKEFGLTDVPVSVPVTYVRCSCELYTDMGDDLGNGKNFLSDHRDINDVIHPANEWFAVPTGCDVRMYVPIWVSEGAYELECVTMAYNHPDPGTPLRAVTYGNANLSVDSYGVREVCYLNVTGRASNLELYGEKDNVRLSPEQVYRSGNRSNIGEVLNTSSGFPAVSGFYQEYGNQTFLVAGHQWLFGIEVSGSLLARNITRSGSVAADLTITPSFYRISEDGQTREPVDIYYRSDRKDDRSWIRIGDNRDLSDIKTVRTDDYYVSGYKGLQVNSGLTVPMYSYGRIYAPEQLWLDSGCLSESGRDYVSDYITAKKLKTTSPQLRAKAVEEAEKVLLDSKKTILFAYSLPTDYIVVSRGYDLAGYLKKNYYVLNGTESFLKKSGYLVVNFDIDFGYSLQGSDRLLEYISYNGILSGGIERCNMFAVEGFACRQTAKGITFDFEAGDVLLLPLMKDRSDYVTVKHLN